MEARMFIEAAQVAAEAARHSGITGTFVLDGALLITGLKVVEAVINKVRHKNPNGKTKPGDGETCKEHSDAIAKFGEFKDNTKERLVRIEGKVDRLLEIRK